MFKNSKKNICAIVQARMESERFSGKVLKSLASKPVLEWVIERINKSKYVDKVILAIPRSFKNQAIINEKYNRNWECNIYQGSMDNVLERVADAAKFYNADIIVDITADCPLADPKYIDIFIEKLFNYNLDYISNTIERTWPDGCDIQVYTYNILEEVYKLIRDKKIIGENERHFCHTGWNIVNYFGKNPKYRMLNYNAPDDFNHPEWGLTLDTEEDYKLLNHIFEIFKDFDTFSIDDVIRYINVNPSLLKMNENIIRKVPGEG